MKLNVKTCALLSGALLASSVALHAQRRGPGGLPPFGAPMELMGFEGMHGGTVVKGAPFSATATSETTSTLQDGSQIHRTSQVTMYRDSQGRSRQEATFNGFGPFAASGGAKKVVSIFDPVAGAHITLDTENKVAHTRRLRTRSEASDSAASGKSPEDWMKERIQKEEAAGTLKRESLGTQTIDGVVAEGTRTTHIIPAGQIGNDKPLQIVSERWYSPDLQIVLKSTRTDPRFGITTYTVANIQRTEPAAALFTVPADFTVQAGGFERHAHGAPGVPPPPSND